MGKKIIIKNADFEENGFSDKYTWLFNVKSGALIANKAIGTVNKYHVQPSELTRLNIIGRTVNCVKFYSSAAATVTFGSWNPTLPYADAEIESYTYEAVAGINKIELLSPIVLSSTCVPFIYSPNANMLYWSDKADPAYGWNFGAYADSAITGRIPVDWGVMKE